MVRDVLHYAADGCHAFFKRWFVDDNVRERRPFVRSLSDGRRRILKHSLRVILTKVRIAGEQDRSDRHSANHGEEFALGRFVLLYSSLFRMKWIVEHSDYFK